MFKYYYKADLNDNKSGQEKDIECDDENISASHQNNYSLFW